MLKLLVFPRLGCLVTRRTIPHDTVHTHTHTHTHVTRLLVENKRFVGTQIRVLT